MAYLVTGRAGSGKSTICLALKQRGYEAYDADAVPGLSDWIDRQTGRPTVIDHTKYVDYRRVGWDWNDTVLKQFLSAHPQALLCGSASNQLDFYALFERVFILELDPLTHRHRLENRRTSDYAKDPQQIREILSEQAQLVEQSLAQGATSLDARQPLRNVVDDLVKTVGYD